MLLRWAYPESKRDPSSPKTLLWMTAKCRVVCGKVCVPSNEGLTRAASQAHANIN
jgi:hypothetical protein